MYVQDDQNLLVPIHAYPVMSTAKFPSHVRFPATPVGRTRNKTLSLECDVPIDFEFQLTVLQHHPAYIITPMRGAGSCTYVVCVYVYTPYLLDVSLMKQKVCRYKHVCVHCTSAVCVCTCAHAQLMYTDAQSLRYCTLTLGVVPANGKVDVMVTFAPTEFNTAIMKLKVYIQYTHMYMYIHVHNIFNLSYEPMRFHTCPNSRVINGYTSTSLVSSWS